MKKYKNDKSLMMLFSIIGFALGAGVVLLSLNILGANPELCEKGSFVEAKSTCENPTELQLEEYCNDHGCFTKADDCYRIGFNTIAYICEDKNE